MRNYLRRSYLKTNRHLAKKQFLVTGASWGISVGVARESGLSRAEKVVEEIQSLDGAEFTVQCEFTDIPSISF